jgi:hypothetical protein
MQHLHSWEEVHLQLEAAEWLLAFNFIGKPFAYIQISC